MVVAAGMDHQQDANADHQADKSNEGPRVKVQAEGGAGVAGVSRCNVQQNLAHRTGGTDKAAQQRHAVMCGLNAETQVQQKTEAGGDETGSLQQTERTGKLAEQELLGESTDQNEGDDGQRQNIQAVHETRGIHGVLAFVTG